MSNDLSPLIPKLLAQGQLALRQYAIMPRLVNRGVEEQAGQKGSTITIPISSAIDAQDVVPDNVSPATADVAPTEVTLTLDQWKEAPFYLTDKDFLEVDRGVIPMQASEAIKSLANTVDKYILGFYKKVYGFAGTPGTTPLATDLSEYLASRKVANNQLAPLDPRFMVINGDTEANALGLRAFQDASFTGNIDGIVNGQINNKVGARWLLDQNLDSVAHVAGTGSGYLINHGGGYAAGVDSVVVDTGSGTILEGDIVTFAGHSQTYTVKTALSGNAFTFSPALKSAVADNAAVTVKGNHALNLLFHRDAFAFASRPFQSSDPMNLGKFMAQVDPVSGLALRLEVTREHKRTRFSYDILYGGACPRPELAVRMVG